MKGLKVKVNKVPDVVENTTIEITARTCSEKLQKNVKVGDRFVVLKVTELRNGVRALEVKDGGKMMRINASRFRWRAVSSDELFKEKAKSCIDMEIKFKMALLKKTFTNNELDHILFTPYIYELLTWHYVGLCHKCAADNKLNFNKISRVAKEQRMVAAKEGYMEVGEKVYEQFVYGVETMTEGLERELTRIWWQVNSEIKRIHPDMKYIELRTYAICGMLALRLLDERENISDNLINKRLKGHMEYQHKGKRSAVLYTILKGYADEATDVDFNRLELCERVLRNNIECIEFTTLHNEIRQIN